MSRGPAALEEVEQELPLNLGMENKSSAELQQPSHMRLVQNLHWRELGQLEQRPADDTNETIAIPSGGNYDIDESCGLIVCDKKALVVTGRYGVVEHDATRDALQFSRAMITSGGTPNDSLKYAPVSYDVTRRFVERTQFNREAGIFNVASAQYNGVQAIAWIVLAQTNVMYCKAIRVDTGEVVATTEQISLGSTAGFMVTACEYTESGKEGVLFAYVNDAASPWTVSTIRYDSATNEFVADSALATNAAAGTFALAKNGNRFYFAYQDNATGFLTVQDRTVSTVTTTHTANHGADAIDIVVGASNTLIVSCTAAGGTAYAEVFGAPANVQTVLTASSETLYKITAASESLSGGAHDAVIFVSTVTTSTPSSSRIRAREVRFATTTPSLGATTTTLPNCVSVANAFTLRGMAHVIVTVYSRLNGSDPAAATSCFVARYRSGGTSDTRFDAVAKIAHDRFYQTNYLSFDVANPGVGKQGVSVYVDQTNSAWLALTADPSPIPAYGGYRLPQSIFLARLDATRPMPMAYCSPEPGVTFVAGAMPWEYDGDFPAEAAPLVEPRAVVDVSVNDPSGPSAATGYGVRFLYRWVDARGRLKRMPGPAINTGVFTTQQLDIYATICPMRTYDEDDCPGEMEVELYLTTDGGSSYFLATDSSGNIRKYDATAGGDCWYKFTNVDPALVSSVPWPLGDAEVEPEPTPGFAHVTKIGDRLWAVDMEDRSRIWFSKPLVAGFGVEWSTLCTLNVGDEAVAVIDVGGYPTVLAKGGIYQIAGPGPDANLSGSFSPAQRLPYEIECLDAASVCRTPIGILFRGRRGLYALADGPRSEPGLLVDPETLTAPDQAEYRTRIVYQEQTNEIHCMVPASGARLVYNVVEQKWSKYTTSGSTLVNDLAVARGKLWRLERASSVDYLRSEKLYSEDGSAYNETTHGWLLRTPRYRFDGVLGQARLWRVFVALALPTDIADISAITLRYYVDDNPTVTDTKTWTGAELATLYPSPSTAEYVTRLPYAPPVQLIRSCWFELECTLSAASAAPKPLALSMSIGVRESKQKRLRETVKGG